MDYIDGTVDELFQAMMEVKDGKRKCIHSRSLILR